MKRSPLLALIFPALGSVGASSCATPVLPTVKPIDANRYEAPFQFECNGKMTFAVGSASCQYQEGDTIRIRIKTPKSRGELQVRSCRHGAALDINQKNSWQEITWVQYTREDSCPIVFTVATVDGGVQMGKIYPYVSNETYPILAGTGSFYCWESETLENYRGQSTCQVPTGIKVNGTVNLSEAKPGRYLVASPCLAQQPPVSFPKGTRSFKWSLISYTSQFCPVSLAVKYDDGTIEESELYIDFFDNTYRMLPAPILAEVRGRSYACAPQDFAFLALNDDHLTRGLFSGQCLRDGWQEGKLAIAIAWDAAGRSSYTIYTKEGLSWINEKMRLQNLASLLKAPTTRQLRQ